MQEKMSKKHIEPQLQQLSNSSHVQIGNQLKMVSEKFHVNEQTKKGRFFNIKARFREQGLGGQGLEEAGFGVAGLKGTDLRGQG